MDKNIKAELSSLKTEIINGLNGIEKLILSLDSKIENSSTYINDGFDPGPKRNYDEMKAIVDRLNNVENVIQEQESNRIIDDIKRRAGLFDKNIQSNLTAKNYSESMSSNVNINEILEIAERLEERGISSDSDLIEAIADKMQEASVPESFEYSADRDNFKVGGPKPEEFKKPEWLNDVDKKSMTQIFEESLKWDEYSQELFVKEWNNSFKKRYDIIMSKLDTFLIIVKNHKRSETRVASIHDAQITIKEFESLETLKLKIINLFTSNTYPELLMMINSKHPSLFVDYYNCLNRLADDIRALEIGVGSFELNFLRVLQTQYRNLLEDHEMDVYELVLIDPSTFKPKEIPADKQSAYKKLQYTNYKKDLSNAYKHLSPNKINDLDYLDSKE